jgi:endonuclease-8
MPEGHTVHRQAAEHALRFGGRRVEVTSPQGRFAAGAALLDGRRLDSTEAYGKHLLLSFAGEQLLHVHLGLIGKWEFGPTPAPAPRGAVRVRLVTEGSYADLRGAMAVEVWSPDDKARLLARLGPDPLRRDAKEALAWQRIARSRLSIGRLLMDQEVLAGVGNVYRAELLYRARIDPHRPGRDVSRDEWLAMWRDLVTLMKAGLRAGRIVTTRPADRRRTSPVRSEDAHYVYRRTGLPCRVCGTPVATELMAGRNLFWCPTCQL